MAVEETGPGTPDSEWATEQDDDVDLARFRTPGSLSNAPSCPSEPFSAPTRRPSYHTLVVLAAFSKLNLSSAAHSSCSNRSPCDFALCCSRARSTKIWPRVEGHYAFAWVVSRTLFSRPVSFLILHAPGKGKQQKRLESPHYDEAWSRYQPLCILLHRESNLIS